MALRVLGLIFSLGFSIACGFLGYGAAMWYLEMNFWVTPPATTAYFTPGFVVTITLAFVALGLLLGFAAGSVIYRHLSGLASNLMDTPPRDKIAGLIGLVIGLTVAILLSPLVDIVREYSIAQGRFPLIPALVLLIYLLCIYGGITLALGMKNELAFFLTRPGPAAALPEPDLSVSPKLLDTNVIIDGRIADICRAGFIEGPIYIPGFVLEELHLIADSSDGLRRARGRRGLDILAQLQKELKTLRVYDHYKTPMPRSEAVDVKLVKLAKEMKAAIITNDFNLNKVASLQGITVLNVNELAAALKPVVLPGEEMTATIVREGKELNQGVAYLDDGTMVVVEGGKQRINDTVQVIVSSVLQTVAGKMIFANLKSSDSQTNSGPEEPHNHYQRAAAASGRRLP